MTTLLLILLVLHHRGGAADVALQQRLGLLSQRRPGPGSHHPPHPVPDRTHLTRPSGSETALEGSLQGRRASASAAEISALRLLRLVSASGPRCLPAAARPGRASRRPVLAGRPGSSHAPRRPRAGWGAPNPGHSGPPRGSPSRRSTRRASQPACRWSACRREDPRAVRIASRPPGAPAFVNRVPASSSRTDPFPAPPASRPVGDWPASCPSRSSLLESRCQRHLVSAAVPQGCKACAPARRRRRTRPMLYGRTGRRGQFARRERTVPAGTPRCASRCRPHDTVTARRTVPRTSLGAIPG